MTKVGWIVTLIRSRNNFWNRLIGFQSKVKDISQVMSSTLGMHHFGTNPKHDIMALSVHHLSKIQFSIQLNMKYWLSGVFFSYLRTEIEQRSDFDRFAEHDVVNVTKNR